MYISELCSVRNSLYLTNLDITSTNSFRFYKEVERRHCEGGSIRIEVQRDYCHYTRRKSH